ncbi:hypothetical protein M413DRAFT_32667 [Hebeloma cylindrosporum]|uniref:Uncharacterized protein n=1 Tax=Hebeloma cylindrosporum TaxID=76867 RepID=A0A0C3BV00_HEBCY|nr:hypothetical protein M413DRAFT_32667 [Hebeloma cylindrosporum h7]
MPLQLTSELEANLLLQIMQEGMFLAYGHFFRKITTAEEEHVWLSHIAQGIAFQNEVISTIHFSQWLFTLEPVSYAIRGHLMLCIRRDVKPKPLPNWDIDLSAYFCRTKGALEYKRRHFKPWWYGKSSKASMLTFNAQEMMLLYTSTTPSPTVLFDPERAVDAQIQWLKSKLPTQVDVDRSYDVLSALEALKDQFHSNIHTCVLKGSGVARTDEQAYSLD